MAQQTTDPIITAIDEFQDALNPTQKAELLAIHGAVAPDAQTVLTFTAEVDRTNQRRQSRCVASRLHGTLQSVQQLTDVVGTFVSSNPAIAALVWGSIRFTILAASNFTQFFDKLSECFMRLQTSCPRFVEYRFLYPDSIRLQRALCSFYATVVRFCAKAVEVIGRTGKHLFFAFVLLLNYFIILLTSVLQDSSNSPKLCGCHSTENSKNLPLSSKDKAKKSRRKQS